jgi:hypothetical protein
MGNLFDAIKQEAAKPPKSSKVDEKLRQHLGEDGWKDLVKAFKDASISSSVIRRVLIQSGFQVSYSAVVRLRNELGKS